MSRSRGVLTSGTAAAMYDIAELDHIGLVLPEEVIREYQADEVTWVMVSHTLRHPLSFDRYGGHPAPFEIRTGEDGAGQPIWTPVIWPVPAVVKPYDGSDFAWRLGKSWDTYPFWYCQGWTPLQIYWDQDPADYDEPRPLRVWAGWPLNEEQAVTLSDNIRDAFEASPWNSLAEYRDLTNEYGDEQKLRAIVARDPNYHEGTISLQTADDYYEEEIYRNFSGIAEEDAALAAKVLARIDDLVSGMPRDENDDWFWPIEMFDVTPYLREDLAELWTRLQGVKSRCLQALVEQGAEHNEIRREEEMSTWD